MKVLMHDTEEPENDPYEYITVCQPEGYVRDEHEEKLENGEMTDEDIEKIMKKCGGEGCMCKSRISFDKESTDERQAVNRPRNTLTIHGS